MSYFKIKENVFLHSIGTPFETTAVVYKEKSKIESFDKKYNLLKDSSLSQIDITLDEDDKIYGLGQQLGSLDKRGKIYRSFAKDEPNHTPLKENLYGAHTFFLVNNIKNQSCFAIFIDYPGEVIFDIGFTDFDKIQIKIEDDNFDIYYFNNKDLMSINSDFLSLIGKPMLVPKWAFGFGQSRWGYDNAKNIDKVLESYKEEKIPLDMIYLDIEYMQDYKDFTINEEKFPNFKDWVSDIKKENKHVIPIIDAGVRIEKGYQVYEEGVKNNYFCKDKDGNDFKVAVWPGLCHFPDFFQEETRIWWGKLYKKLIDLGIDGFWNDMNEPAIFYTLESLKGFYQFILESQKDGEDIDLYKFFKVKDAGQQMLNGARDDYKIFYHNIKDKMIVNEKVHNLYGFYMTKALSCGLKEELKKQRYLFFSRSSYIGAHRYGGIWMGDNHSQWEHVLLNLKMGMSLNMCGFIFCGADIGGFGGDSYFELALRWTQLGIFFPLFRNHSASQKPQEAFAFGKENTKYFKNTIKLRYKLIPYLYSEFLYSRENNLPFVYPLIYKFPKDEDSSQIEDEAFVGRNLLICPVYTPNTKKRNIYLPDDMLMIKYDQDNNLDFFICKKGYHKIDYSYKENIFFLQKNHILVLSDDDILSVDEKKESLKIIGFKETSKEEIQYILKDDDGISYDNESNLKIVIKNEEVLISGTSDYKKFDFLVLNENGEINTFDK